MSPYNVGALWHHIWFSHITHTKYDMSFEHFLAFINVPQLTSSVSISNHESSGDNDQGQRCLQGLRSGVFAKEFFHTKLWKWEPGFGQGVAIMLKQGLNFSIKLESPCLKQGFLTSKTLKKWMHMIHNQTRNTIKYNNLSQAVCWSNKQMVLRWQTKSRKPQLLKLTQNRTRKDKHLEKFEGWVGHLANAEHRNGHLAVMF